MDLNLSGFRPRSADLKICYLCSDQSFEDYLAHNIHDVIFMDVGYYSY